MKVNVKGRVRLGLWRKIIPVPSFVFNVESSKQRKEMPARADLLSEEERMIHHFIVRELPNIGKPMTLAFISQGVHLPIERVEAVVDKLEKIKTFIYRYQGKAINWAYPVTVDNTPHQITFSTGERINAAWAIDAIATPFVQGKLRKEHLSFEIKTECAQSGQPMRIEMDSDLKVQSVEEGADPLIFLPKVNIFDMRDPSIVDVFWRKSVFFWSEEHAKAYRAKKGGGIGIHLTLEQSLHITPIMQGTLFGFPPND